MAVRADVTVTLGAVKTGLLGFPAADLVGQLVIHGIGVPDSAHQGIPIGSSRGQIGQRRRRAALAPTVQPWPRHDRRRIGTLRRRPYLAAAAAARSGAGLVILAAPDSVQRVAAIQLPEATYTEQPVEPERDPDAAVAAIASNLGQRRCHRHRSRSRSIRRRRAFPAALFQHRAALLHPPPTVVDGDTLSLLGDWDNWQSSVGPGLVLTPHHGEMGRLLGKPLSFVTNTPWVIARDLARSWGRCWSSKGPSASYPPVADTWIHPWANPALATAGAGDVLAGLIGGLLAELRPGEASRLAVWAHARCAERLIRRRRWRTLLASDLLPQIPRVLNQPRLPEPRP